MFWIVHQDADIVVVDKRAGLLTVRTPLKDEDDLVTMLRHYFGHRGNLAEVRAAHRLDRPVSGLLVMARHAEAHRLLIQQFARQKVERQYIAGTDGLIAQDEGTFESELVERQDTLRMERVEAGQGKKAVTHWKVRARMERSKATLVDVRLETGLKNQIRVHFADAGHPLLGERKYLPEDHPERRSVQGFRRIFLHAATLGFEHPIRGERMSFSSKLPPDLDTWRKELLRPPISTRKKIRHRNRKDKGKPRWAK